MLDKEACACLASPPSASAPSASAASAGPTGINATGSTWATGTTYATGATGIHVNVGVYVDWIPIRNWNRNIRIDVHAHLDPGFAV